MREIHVTVPERPYTVRLGRGVAGDLGRLLAPLGRARVAVVSTPPVWERHRARVTSGLDGLSWTQATVPDGERFKTARTLQRVYDVLADAGLGRDGLVLAVGGGVLGDLAGFAAATYMRGVDWVPVPTTLLAMVDSAVGGKVGINHPRAKNMIGAFHQPRLVAVDPLFLDTLPPRQRQTGAYEVLKCGIIGDPVLFESVRAAPPGLEGWAPDLLDDAIARSVALKADVVSRDEREGGLRQVLNLGHTLGHALEAVTAYRRFTHGEAVGWGLIGEAALARRRGLLSPADFEAIAGAVDALGPRPGLRGLSAEPVLEAVARDKKARQGRVPFVLPTAIGAVSIVPDVDRGEVLAAFDEISARRARPRRRQSPISRR
ncbi:MAG TPA: 3-dehydroquinate synthase [Vicinamibacteria bacterium]|nr:3-dehydroquinate synthase [Vicinamibacteria bacterium]